jgi:hypothetical protein
MWQISAASCFSKPDLPNSTQILRDLIRRFSEKQLPPLKIATQDQDSAFFHISKPRA